MKKLILFALVSFLLIPSLANAQLVCDEASYPFRSCQVVQEFSNAVAGNPTTAKVDFKFIGNAWAPLVVRVNVSSSGYTFTPNDFSGFGSVLTKALIGPVEYTIPLVCGLPPVYFSQTVDAFGSPLPNNFTFYCYNPAFYIVMPQSLNDVSITLIPNIALISPPSPFSFTVELMTDVGVPILEPNVTIENGFGNLSINPPHEKLEFYFDGKQNLTVQTLVYSSVFYKKFPSERPFNLIFFDFKNSTPFNGTAQVRYYFDPDEITGKGWDKNNIRVYRFDPSTLSWILMNSGVTDNYVWVNLTGFSLYGVFTSFFYPPAQPPSQTFTYPTTYVTQTITQNITQPERYYVERVVNATARAVCGNNICEVGESCSICPDDCRCPSGYDCREGICVVIPVCGNNVCEAGENAEVCPADCPTTPSPIGIITGAVVAVTTNPIYAGLSALAVIAAILTVFRAKFLGKKSKSET